MVATLLGGSFELPCDQVNDSLAEVIIRSIHMGDLEIVLARGAICIQNGYELHEVITYVLWRCITVIHYLNLLLFGLCSWRRVIGQICGLLRGNEVLCTKDETIFIRRSRQM